MSSWCDVRWPVSLPWCKRWGRFCEQHLRGLDRPLGPDSSSEQTPRGHSGSAPTRRPRPYTQAERLCRCEAWGGPTLGNREIKRQTFYSLWAFEFIEQDFFFLWEKIRNQESHLCPIFFFPFYIKKLLFFKLQLFQKITQQLSVPRWSTWGPNLALSIASVRCTLLSWPKQNRSPPEGST